MAKATEISVDDLEVKVSAELEFYILDKNKQIKQKLDEKLNENRDIKNIIYKLNT